ncbi:MAG: transporter [Desulfuromonadales bacterium]
MKTGMISSLLSALCLLCAAPAFAAHPLATDDAGTNGRMKFQVETSAEFAWDKRDSITADSQSVGLVVSAGLLDTLDVFVAFPITWQQVKDNGEKLLDNGGLNDLSMSLKWRFLELGPASLAIKPAVTFPTGDYNRSLGSGRPAYGVTLISTVEFKPIAVHANMGYTLQKYTDADKSANRESIWNFSLAGTFEVMHRLQLVAEIGTATNPDKASTIWPTFMTGGIIYSAFDSLDLSLGVKGGLNSPETDIALLTGLTFKFP